MAQVNAARARELSEVDAGLLREIERFFVAYNRAQRREFEVTGRAGGARRKLH